MERYRPVVAHRLWSDVDWPSFGTPPIMLYTVSMRRDSPVIALECSSDRGLGVARYYNKARSRLYMITI